MGYDPDRHHRRSIRLKGYDYSRSGYYYITICTKDREKLFGEIDEAIIRLNEAGQMIDQEWNQIHHHKWIYQLCKTEQLAAVQKTVVAITVS